MRTGLTVVLAVALALGVVAAATEALLAPAVESYLARAIARLVPEHKSLSVKVHSFPAVGLLRGRIERLAIDVEAPRLAGRDLAWLALRGADVDIDVRALRERRLHVRDAEQLLIEAAWTGEQLTEYVQSQLPQVSDVTVDLLSAAVRVRGRVSVLGRNLQAMAIGTVEPAGDSGIRFVPDEIAVEGVGLPDALVRAVAALLEWHLDLTSLPFEVRIESLAVADGYLVARGVWVTEG